MHNKYEELGKVKAVTNAVKFAHHSVIIGGEEHPHKWELKKLKGLNRRKD